MAAPPDPLTPDWWVQRLYKQLVADTEVFDAFSCYYAGDHPLPWLAPQAREEFRRVLRMARANLMGLVCDATAERLQIIGFRVGDGSQGDKDSQRIWQSNDMDLHSDLAILEAVITGRAYLMVAPNLKDAKTPLITAEHPSQVITECTPGSSGRDTAAGLKVWLDDWTGMLCATLYLPPGPKVGPKALIFKYQTKAPTQQGIAPSNIVWERRVVAREAWPAANPLGEVPLYLLPNNPRLLATGVSEIADVTDVQDRINKTLADRLITQDYGAFPQKWAVAWPDTDDKGNPQPKIDVGRDRMVTSSVTETKFGQWEAAALDPYSGAKREDAKDVASRTRTPAQYLLGELTNVNGETLKAAESGLISKVRQRARGYDNGMEAAMAAARRLAGLGDIGVEQIEAMWRNPEYRTEGELVDSLLKAGDMHVPPQVLWEKWGATPAEIARWEDLAFRNANDPRWKAIREELNRAPVEQVRVTESAPLPADAPTPPP